MRNLLAQIFDAVFIILLCFVVLFLSMTLISGAAAHGAGYSPSIPMLAFTAAAVFCYLFLMIRCSTGEFRDITEHAAGSKEEGRR